MSNELTWLPAWRIRDLIAKKEVSAVAVTEHFLGRIEHLDSTLHAFRTVDASGARAQAKQADAVVARGDTLGSLHGVPIALKEHILIQGLPTREFGATDAPPALHDDIGTERLRKAGAVIVGHNVMPGMGNSPLTGGRDTDLALHARNPWDPTRVPGSSSAGGAAATASAMLPLTIGSDGGGSTRLPGAFTGVVAMHPTVGRIPFVSYRQPMARMIMVTSTIGPLSRDVRDAAIVLQAMAGPDGRDFLALQDDAPDYVTDLDQGVDGMRMAWTDDYGYGSMYAQPQTPKIIDTVRAAAQTLAKIGARLETTAEQWEDFWPSYMLTSLIYGFGPSFPGFKPEPEAVQAAHEVRMRNWQRFRKLFTQFDLLLSPTAQITAFTVEGWDTAWNKEGAKYTHGMFAPTYTADTHMFNWLGFPAISVPCGFVDGMPVGLQIVGKPNTDAKVLRAAAAFMQAAPRTERPKVS